MAHGGAPRLRAGRSFRSPHVGRVQVLRGWECVRDGEKVKKEIPWRTTRCFTSGCFLCQRDQNRTEGDEGAAEDEFPGEGFTEKEKREHDNQRKAEAIETCEFGCGCFFEAEKIEKPGRSAKHTGQGDHSHILERELVELFEFATCESRDHHESEHEKTPHRRGQGGIHFLQTQLSHDGHERGGQSRKKTVDNPHSFV